MQANERAHHEGNIH